MRRAAIFGGCGVLLLTLGWGNVASVSFGDQATARDYQQAIAELEAAQEQTLRQLPEWLKLHYRRGLLAEVDDTGCVVSLTVSGIMTDDLLARLDTLPKLRDLHVECTTNITPAGLAHLSKLAALEKLSVFDVNGGGAGLGDEILRNARHIASLRDLSVSECGLTDLGARFLESMPQLSRLTLGHEGRLTDAALDSVAKLTHLRSLHLPSCVGTESYGRMRFSPDALLRLTVLTELEELGLAGHAPPAKFFVFPKLTYLSVGGVDDAAAAQIARCHDLERLELMYSLISDDGLRQIATLPNLIQLDLSSTVTTDAGIELFKQSANLKHVCLRAPVSDASLKHLSEIATIERLDLSGSALPGSQIGTNFTMQGLQQLKHLPKLRTLFLNNLRLEGGFSGLAELKQVRYLSMMMTNIDEDEVYRLEEAMPETVISSGVGKILPKQVRAALSAPQ